MDNKNHRPDYIRLNLERIGDLGDMMVAKSNEFYDISVSNLVIKLRFNDEVSNSHGSPLNGETNWGGYKKHLPRGYPGWSGKIECSVDLGHQKNHFNRGANQYLFGSIHNNQCGFRGFHTSSGCPGSTSGEYPMDIGFYLFLDDFPLLKKRYEKWKILSSFEVNKNWVDAHLAYSQLIKGE